MINGNSCIINRINEILGFQFIVYGDIKEIWKIKLLEIPGYIIKNLAGEIGSLKGNVDIRKRLVGTFGTAAIKHNTLYLRIFRE